MTGEQLYNAYREERILQGWQEFLWTSMSKTQQLVWSRLAERVVSERIAPASGRSVIPFAKPTGEKS